MPRKIHHVITLSIIKAISYNITWVSSYSTNAKTLKALKQLETPKKKLVKSLRTWASRATKRKIHLLIQILSLALK